MVPECNKFKSIKLFVLIQQQLTGEIFIIEKCLIANLSAYNLLGIYAKSNIKQSYIEMNQRKLNIHQ